MYFLKKTNEGYYNLLNANKKQQYCIKRAPVSTIIPDKLGQPVAIEIPTQSSLCGDHCPFFNIQENIYQVNLCENRFVSYDSIIESETNNLKLV